MKPNKKGAIIALRVAVLLMAIWGPRRRSHS